MAKAIGPALHVSTGDAMRKRNLLAAVVIAAHEVAGQFGLIGYKALHACKPSASFLSAACMQATMAAKGAGGCAKLLLYSKPAAETEIKSSTISAAWL